MGARQGRCFTWTPTWPKRLTQKEPFFEVFTKQLKRVVQDANKIMNELSKIRKVEKAIANWNTLFLKYNVLLDEKEEFEAGRAIQAARSSFPEEDVVGSF